MGTILCSRCFLRTATWLAISSGGKNVVVGNVDGSAARNQLKKGAIFPSRCSIIFRDEIRVYEPRGGG